jgi:LmbE family N-acetylglucosaminyl deacetylase
MSRVLVISPHPDDESVGCGGTLRKHVVAGDAVHLLFLTSGEQGGHGRSPQVTAGIREREACRAARVLGIPSDRVEFWRQPDGALRASLPLVERLLRRLRELAPALVYVTHAREAHRDHRAAQRLVRRAVPQLRGGLAQPEIRQYEVWTPLQRLDHIEDISAVLEVKLRAIRAYRCQCAVVGFDAAMRGLARYRGEMHCWPEGEYAEVFQRLRP